MELQRTKAYRVFLSTGGSIRIDEEEIEKVFNGMAEGAIIMVKQGLINPSYVTGVSLDDERMQEWRRECQYNAPSETDPELTQGQVAKQRGVKPLKDIYGNSPVRKLLEQSQRKLEEKMKQTKLTDGKK